MENTVSWVVELAVRPLALDSFRSLTDEMVEATRAEPGALVYERFVSGDGGIVHLYERYVVYGDPSPELRAVLDGIGAAYLRPLGGFSR